MTPATVPDPADRAAATAFAQALAKALSDYAIASAITSHIPELGFGLKLLGLLDWQSQDRDPSHGLSRGHVHRGLQLDKFKDLIDDPGAHLLNTLGWGSPAFDPTDFFRLVREFFPREYDMQVGVQGGDPFLRACVVVRRDSSVNPPGLRITFLSNLSADKTLTTPLNEQWRVGVTSNLRMTGGISGLLTPPLDLKLQPLGGEIKGELRVFADRAEAARPFDLLAGTGGLLLISANNLAAGLGIAASWNVADGTAHVNPLLFANLDGVTLKIGSADADGFVAKLLASANIQGQFDLGLEWQADTGLRVTASGGVEIAIPIHKSLGPIEFEVVYLVLRIESDGTLALEVSTGLTGTLGPITVTIDRIGALAKLRFASGADAKFGPFDLGLGFKPPSGAGLAIDAAIVKGGGYLYFDPDKGEYAGVAELSVAEIVTVKAIGLVTTKLPDGTPGFSLLVIISAEFTPIQLGFGFTLNGVGGLLGLNRSVLLDVLRDGVRTGAINSIMFPSNPVANAPKIISDLKAVFPPQQGTFLVGPMAKVGWGTPSLVTLSLGIIIEIPPGNIAILGVLKVALPEEDEAIILIQVNFVGILDFDKQLLSFDASLYESRIVFITLEGDMAIRLKWGDNPGFLLSVGGFHPAFHPPPLDLPTLRRLTISILDYDWAKIKIETYFAVTSNTVQFGAHAYLFFGVDSAHISGQIGFDVLFQFSPFYFNAMISGSLDLQVGGLDLLSIDLRFSLEGPTPYRAHGTGSISILFFSIDVDFDVTWGDQQDTSLPPVHVLPIFVAEVQKQQSWKALPPPSSNLLVSLRQLDPALAVLHPFGALEVTQRALPLDLTLDKLGTQKPDDVNRLDITSATSGTFNYPLTPVEEQFAAAQYQQMTDAEKLSRPSFQQLKGGVTIGAAGGPQSSKMTRRKIAYQVTIIDKEPVRRPLWLLAIGALFHPFLAGAAVARSPLSFQAKSQLAPYADKVAVGPEGFTIASTHDNTAVAGQATFSSEAMASEYMQRRLDDDPSLAGTMHVLPNHEVQAA